jgi:hypothetical protein
LALQRQPKAKLDRGRGAEPLGGTFSFKQRIKMISSEKLALLITLLVESIKLSWAERVGLYILTVIRLSLVKEYLE